MCLSGLHCQRQPLTNDFVFGYGSIANCESRMSSMGKARCRAAIWSQLPASVGMVRSFNFRKDTGFTALGITQVPDSGRDIAGVCFNAGCSMSSFDEREDGYDRVPLRLQDLRILDAERNFMCDCPFKSRQCTASSLRFLVACIRGGVPKGMSLPRIWIYIPKPSLMHLPCKEFPLLQSYIDIVLDGFLAWGGLSAALEFCDSTDGWSTYYLNNVPESRRPWLHRTGSWKTIENVLWSQRTNTKVQERRHPEDYSLLVMREQALQSVGVSTIILLIFVFGLLIRTFL